MITVPMSHIKGFKIITSNLYYCYVNKKWFPRLETIFVVDHIVVPIRFSLLRKEAKQLLFTVSVDAKNS
jgi:hypothetical protein